MPSLNSAQKEAVEYIGGPLLVLAGPGTGKTQLLSAKVAYILKNTDTNPENILCLTFTDAGARNMRDRLRSMIGQDASSVNIHTYHAFGSDLLAQYKNYATDFSRLLDQPIDTVTQYKIIQSIQSSLPATDILKTANISDILSTISSAKSARLSATDLAKIADYNIEKTRELNQAASPIIKNLIPRMKFAPAVDQVYQPLLETLIKYTSPDPILKNIEPEANFLARELKALLDEESTKEKPSVSPLTKWKNANFELDSEGNYRLKNVVSNKKLASLAHVMEKYDEYLRAEGLFDFADMIEEAIRILKEDDGFRLTLSERYQYVLLDEFQDTNPSQFELIHLLTDYESPCIMAVGDDDQAIFAFQGANASNLLDFQKTYDAKVITLTENYRSTQEILDSSYKIAQQISDSFAKHHNIVKRLKSMKDKIRNSIQPSFRGCTQRSNKLFSAGVCGAYERAQAAEPRNDGREERAPAENGFIASREDGGDAEACFTGIARHEFLSSDSEYFWVAQKIHDLIKSGEKQSDIAIITPKHKYITPLLPYLKAYDDINITYEKRENVLEEPAIHELTTLARFIYESSRLEPATYRLLEIFSFPRWHIDPAVAISALQSHPTLKDLEDSDDENLSSAAKTLSTLIAQSFETPLDQLLSEMLNLEAEDDYEKFHLYELLSVLRENLTSHIKEPNPKLKDFIEFLDDYESAGEAILNTSPYQDSENAVQIMTAHKSKGLEFKHVFLVATDNMSWGKAKGNNNQLTLPKNLTQIRHTGITDDERLRLFFVAITRAEQTLTMTNSIKDFSGKSPARLDYLEEYESKDGLVSPFLPDPVIYTHYDDLSDDQKERALSYQWLSAYQKLTPDLKPLLEKRLETLHFSASHLTTFVDLRYAGPMEFYKRYLLRAPAEPATAQIIFGNLIHNTFEAITNNSLDFNQALEFYKEKLDESPVTPDQAKDLLEKGTASLTASFKKFLPILQHPGAHAEVNLAPEHLMLDEILLTGKIDHLNIDEENKTIEVYDFKTGPYHAEGWNSYPSLFLYKLQLEFYKLLLNLSPTYYKYTVTTGHILFVSPDSADGQVHDKSYEFTDASSEELKSLLRAVYAHVKSLDFLDDSSPLCIYPDSSRSVKNIKDFISTLAPSTKDN